MENDFGVILLGHLDSELAETKLLLETSISRASVQIVVMDVQTATLKEMVNTARTIEKLHITILANNGGGNPVVPPPMRGMITHTITEIYSVIDQNARFIARLTTLVLPI